MFTQLFLSSLQYISMVNNENSFFFLDSSAFLFSFLNTDLFFGLKLLIFFSGLMEIVMQWNVLCMKIFEAFFLTNKNSINFRVQAIIILFDHQHVDIMFFFQITMMTMTKQKFHFLKGAKFLFHWSFSAKFDVIIFFKKWVVYTHHNKLKFVFFKLCFVQLGLFCNGILTSFKRVEILIIIFQFSKASTPKVFFFFWCFFSNKSDCTDFLYTFLKGAELKGRVFDSTWFIFLHSFNFSIALWKL